MHLESTASINGLVGLAIDDRRRRLFVNDGTCVSFCGFDSKVDASCPWNRAPRSYGNNLVRYGEWEYNRLKGLVLDETTGGGYSLLFTDDVPHLLSWGKNGDCPTNIAHLCGRTGTVRLVGLIGEAQTLVAMCGPADQVLLMDVSEAGVFAGIPAVVVEIAPPTKCGKSRACFNWGAAAVDQVRRCLYLTDNTCEHLLTWTWDPLRRTQGGSSPNVTLVGVLAPSPDTATEASNLLAFAESLFRIGSCVALEFVDGRKAKIRGTRGSAPPFCSARDGCFVLGACSTFYAARLDITTKGPLRMSRLRVRPPVSFPAISLANLSTSGLVFHACREGTTTGRLCVRTNLLPSLPRHSSSRGNSCHIVARGLEMSAKCKRALAPGVCQMANVRALVRQRSAILGTLATFRTILKQTAELGASALQNMPALSCSLCGAVYADLNASELTCGNMTLCSRFFLFPPWITTRSRQNGGDIQRTVGVIADVCFTCTCCNGKTSHARVRTNLIVSRAGAVKWSSAFWLHRLPPDYDPTIKIAS